MAPFWEDFGHPGGGLGASWGVLGASWGLLGASWGHLGASWSVLGRLGRLLGRPDAVLEASWAPKPSNINLTRHGTGSAVLSRARSCRSLMERFWIAKLPQVPERSARFARSLALRVFIGVSLGFCWGFAGDLGSQTSQTLCKSSAKSSENRAQYPQKSTPKPSRIDPRG